MSFYAKRITIEPGITSDNPKVVEIPLNENWIIDIWVGFPKNTRWKVGVRIYYGIRRYFPENPDEWIWGDNIFIPIKQIVKLPAKMESIKIYCISPEAAYPHDVLIYCWTSEEEVEPIEVSLVKLLKGFGL